MSVHLQAKGNPNIIDYLRIKAQFRMTNHTIARFSVTNYTVRLNTSDE